jgi:signal transduction histidine kinase
VRLDLACAGDAGRRDRGHNGGVTEPTNDPIGEAAAHISRVAGAASRRILASPDGLLGLALVLGFLSLFEVALYTDDEGAAMVANLFATVPLAILRRQTALATVAIVFGVLVAMSDDAGALTISGLVGLVVALYVFSARYRRRWSALVALPFLVNALAPFDGTDPSFPNVLLLVVVIGAQALGDSQRERGRAIAERDETRRAMADTLHDQAAMGERARIARDLHDVVAHHVSAIAVQAE